jgi:hypothetical protein
MGEITEFNPAALPVPSKLAQFEKRANAAIQLLYGAYDAETGDFAKQRDWIRRYDELVPVLASLGPDLDALARPTTRAEIADAIKALRSNFHNSGKNVTGDTTRILAECIGSKEPSAGALKLAVLRMFEELEFFPVSKNALDALAAATAFLNRIRDGLRSLPGWRARVSDALAQSERDHATYVERRAAQAAYERSLMVKP